MCDLYPDIDQIMHQPWTKGYLFWNTENPDYFPPLYDFESQKEWLLGFLHSHAEYPSSLFFDECETVEQSLMRLLRGFNELEQIIQCLHCLRKH